MKKSKQVIRVQPGSDGTLIAEGIFSWWSPERVTDRYGQFCVSHTSYDGDKAPMRVWPALETFVGKRVKVMALVVDNRPSGHLGDYVHKIKPNPATVGTIVVVGVGMLATSKKKDDDDDLTFIELAPDKPRAAFWCDPRQLYRLHDQTVALYALETTEPGPSVFEGKVADQVAVSDVDEIGGQNLQVKARSYDQVIPFTEQILEKTVSFAEKGDGLFVVERKPLRPGQHKI